VTSLTIFTNFRINDEERFQRMKDSFNSIKEINAAKWIINVRGDYRDETSSFLKNNLKNLVEIHNLESKKGWFYDTKILLDNIKTDYILYWTEDHINLASINDFNSILQELELTNTDYMFTSWFIFDKMTNVYKNINMTQMKFIDVFDLDKILAKKIKKTHPHHYIISLQGIFKTTLFKKIVNSKHPYLRRWPKETPFDLEKKITDIEFLPFKTAIPKYELFAPIDDDMCGYPCSLQTRGLYPKRELRIISNPGYVPNLLIIILQKVLTKKQRRILNMLIIKPYFKITKFCERISYHF
jgi:hypothetical protein